MVLVQNSVNAPHFILAAFLAKFLKSAQTNHLITQLLVSCETGAIRATLKQVAQELGQRGSKQSQLEIRAGSLAEGPDCGRVDGRTHGRARLPTMHRYWSVRRFEGSARFLLVRMTWRKMAHFLAIFQKVRRACPLRAAKLKSL